VGGERRLFPISVAYPYFYWNRRRLREAGREAFAMRCVRRGEHHRTRRDVLLDQFLMHVGRRQQAEARMRARAAAFGKAKGYPFAEGFDHAVLPG
jgi:hypothetical protein